MGKEQESQEQIEWGEMIFLALMAMVLIALVVFMGVVIYDVARDWGGPEMRWPDPKPAVFCQSGGGVEECCVECTGMHCTQDYMSALLRQKCDDQ